MSGRILRHLQSNVVAYLALFFALGGLAYAAGLPKNSVKSKQIKDGQVKPADLAVNAVDTSKILDATITGVDVDDATLFNDNSLNAADVDESTLFNDNSLNAADVDESTLFNDNSLNGSDVDESTLFNDNSVNGADVDETSLFNDNSVNGADVDEASLSGFDPNQVGPRAYGRIESAGTVTEADTKGLTDAGVTIAGASTASRRALTST